MFCGWSDILIIDKNSITKFCKICGVFAAQRIFAEIAVPTALIQASDNVVVNKENDLFLGTVTLGELDDIEKKYNYNLNELMADWPKNLNYLHPFKLSKWTYKG